MRSNWITRTPPLTKIYDNTSPDHQAPPCWSHFWDIPEATRNAGIVVEAVRAKNRNKSKIRSGVEHVFGVVKRLRFGKVRYRGLQKNARRALTA